MKQILFISLICFTLISKADYWLPKTNYPHVTAAAVSFSIGTKGYLGGGGNYSIVKKDFWEYNSLTNAWTQKADLGGGRRYGGIGFSIGNKGFIGMGGESIFLSVFKDDFWEYDTTLNIWTQKGNFPGGPRLASVSFVIGDKAFVTTGKNDTINVNDLWEYYPATDTWIQKASIPTTTRSGAIGFAIGNKGYVGLGYDNNGMLLNDFWEFDSLSNSWSQKSYFPGTARANAIGFGLSGRGYAGIGESPWGSFNSSFYQYNPHTDTWNQKASFGGGLRDEAIFMVIGNKAYVGTGGAYPGIYSDLWEYIPDSIETGMEELHAFNSRFYISPNPSKEFIRIGDELEQNKIYEISILNSEGKICLHTLNYSSQTKINIFNFLKGIYFVEISDGKNKALKKFVKEE